MHAKKREREISSRKVLLSDSVSSRTPFKAILLIQPQQSTTFSCWRRRNVDDDEKNLNITELSAFALSSFLLLIYSRFSNHTCPPLSLARYRRSLQLVRRFAKKKEKHIHTENAEERSPQRDSRVFAMLSSTTSLFVLLSSIEPSLLRCCVEWVNYMRSEMKIAIWVLSLFPLACHFSRSFSNNYNIIINSHLTRQRQEPLSSRSGMMMLAHIAHGIEYQLHPVSCSSSILLFFMLCNN